MAGAIPWLFNPDGTRKTFKQIHGWEPYANAFDPQVFESMKKIERRDALGNYSGLRQQLEKSFAGRNIGRSGFAQEALANVGSAEANALAAIQAGSTEGLQGYTQQAAEITAQRKAQFEAMQAAKKAAKKKKRGGWLSAGLGGIGAIAGGVLGTLALPGYGTVAGAGAGSQFGSSLGSAFGG